MKNTLDIVVAGHLCLDIIPGMQNIQLQSPENFFSPGKLINTEKATVSTGGCVSNTGLGLSKIGIPVALIGKVGNDAFGKIVTMLINDGFDIIDRTIIDDSAITSHTIVLSPKGFDRMFLHCPGANDTFCSNDIDINLISQAQHFHFGYPPLMKKMFINNGEELIKIFQLAKNCKVTTSLDMALPDPNSESGKVNWKEILKNILPYVDIFLPSVEEIMYMICRDKFNEYINKGNGDIIPLLTGDDLHYISNLLLSLGAKIIMIKCGHRGTYLRTAKIDKLNQIDKPFFKKEEWENLELWQPVYKLNVTPNTTGSGDATIAGFLAAYIKGCSARETVCYANAVGACSVTAPGALTGIKKWEEVAEMLRKGWEIVDMKVEGDGWEKIENIWQKIEK